MKENFDIMFPDNRTEGETILRQSQLVMLRILKIVDYICEKNDIKYWLDGGTLIGAVRHKGFIPWDDDIDITMLREDYDKFIKIVEEELPEDLFLQTNHKDLDYDMPWIKVRDNKSEIIEYKIGDYHNGIFIDIFPADLYGDKYEESLKAKKRFKFIYRTLILVKEPFEKVINNKLLLKNTLKFFSKVLLFPFTFMSKKKIFDIIYRRRDKLVNKFTDKNGQTVGYGIDVLFWNFKMEKEDMFPLRKIEFEDSKFYVPNNYHKYLSNMFGDYMKLPPAEQRVQHNLNINPLKKKSNDLKMVKSFG